MSLGHCLRPSRTQWPPNFLCPVDLPFPTHLDWPEFTAWCAAKMHVLQRDVIAVAVVQSLSGVQLFVTPWTLTHQAPLSMEFSTQEYWSGLHFLFQRIIPDQYSNPSFLLGKRFFITEPPGKPYVNVIAASYYDLYCLFWGTKAANFWSWWLSRIESVITSVFI